MSVASRGGERSGDIRREKDKGKETEGKREREKAFADREIKRDGATRKIVELDQ